MPMHRSLTRAVLLVGMLVSGTASATVWNFDLDNHPDGNQNPPPYGLRLDGLFTGNSSDVWTFSFVDVGLVVDDAGSGSATISGTVNGGRDTGSDYATGTQASWGLSFTFTGITIGADGAFTINTGGGVDAANTGALTLLDDIDLDGNAGSDQNKAINLVGFMGGTFAEDSYRCSGHPGCGPWVGRAWLNHSIQFGAPATTSHIAASDFIFTATPVPEPTALALLGLGLTAFGWRRRRVTG